MFYYQKKQAAFQEDGFSCLLLFLKRCNCYGSVGLEWTEVKTYEVKFCDFEIIFFVILLSNKLNHALQQTSVILACKKCIFIRFFVVPKK